jgi:peptide/nickel transport system permease protein
MVKFALERLGVALLVALVVSFLAFAMIHVSGDPAIALVGEGGHAKEIENVRSAYGFDRPFLRQYLDWLGAAVRGDLGHSYTLRAPVADVIASRLPTTLFLAACALTFAVALGIPVGVLAGASPKTLMDRAALALAVIGQAFPAFLVALTLVFWLGVRWQLLPVSGSTSWANFVMPAVALGFALLAGVVRLTRTCMLDVMASDYIRTARAKGLRPFSVMFKHALRNAIAPVVSLAAVQFGFMLGGSVVIETIFQIDGLGYLAWESIQRKDLPTMQAIVLILSVVYVCLTFLADLANAFLNPRLRLT